MKKQDLQRIWGALFPYPIGSKVKYVRKTCICRECTLRSYFGETGIVIGYSGGKNSNANSARYYSDLSKDEIFYRVKMKNTIYLRHCEIELIDRGNGEIR